MKPSELNKIKVLLAPIFSELDVQKVVLFGSCARDADTRRSDLDLMIVMATEKRFFDRFDQFDSIYRLISDRAIDLLIYTPDELKKISHRPFIRRILHEGLTIYEH